MSSYGHYGPEPDDVRWVSCPACGSSRSVRAGFSEVCEACRKWAHESRWGELRFDLATKRGRENYQRCLEVVNEGATMTDEIKPCIDEDLMIEDTGDRIYLGVPRKAGDKIARIIAMWDVTDYTQEAREQVIRVAEAIVRGRRMAQWAERARSYLLSVNVLGPDLEEEHVDLLNDYPGKDGGS